MYRDFFALFGNEVFLHALKIFLNLWPIWLPVIALDLGLRNWLNFRRLEWINKQGSVLLEIKLPQEMFKSPAAMEVFLGTLHQTGVGTLTHVYGDGRVRNWFSLELVSHEGSVHFYIWMHKNFKKAVETQLYAHFPAIEVHEVPDYALEIPYDTTKYKFLKLSNIVLTKANAYPIKTYIDFGLDKDPDEEYKNDPIVPVLEFLGSLNKGEHAWIQILLQGHTKEGLKYGRLIPQADWKIAAEKEIKDIAAKGKYKGPEDKSNDPKFMSDRQKDIIKAIERTLEKPAFDTMIRAFYFAETEAANPANIGGILGAFRSFSSVDLNGFKPGWSPNFDYPWEDFQDIRKKKREQMLLEAYKRRSFFNPPFKHLGDKPYILTTEEVATMYHFPSAMVAATPTLSRIPSKKAEAPANLPI